jgi:transposase InsO family protein
MMAAMLTLILTGLLRGVRTHRALVLENLALRHQLGVLQRTAPRPRLRASDRVFWVLLARLWHGWAEVVASVQPETVIRWQRAGFRLVWTVFSSQIRSPGIQEVKIAPRSPWQNPYVERLIGTLRRECLDHVVVLNDAHLRRVLRAYLAYYHEARTHLSLGKDTPEPRSVERPDRGRILATPMIGGLHHRYTRRAA